jgi:hypothetical protein
VRNSRADQTNRLGLGPAWLVRRHLGQGRITSTVTGPFLAGRASACSLAQPVSPCFPGPAVGFGRPGHICVIAAEWRGPKKHRDAHFGHVASRFSATPRSSAIWTTLCAFVCYGKRALSCACIYVVDCASRRIIRRAPEVQPGQGGGAKLQVPPHANRQLRLSQQQFRLSAFADGLPRAIFIEGREGRKPLQCVGDGGPAVDPQVYLVPVKWLVT